MKKIVWGLCLMGVAAPVSAAFFQQKADEQPEAKAESPVKVNVQGADEALAEEEAAIDDSRSAMNGIGGKLLMYIPDRIVVFLDIF